MISLAAAAPGRGVLTRGSAAVAAALRDWRDRQWQNQLADAYAELAERDGGTAATDPIEAAREAAALAEIRG